MTSVNPADSVWCGIMMLRFTYSYACWHMHAQYLVVSCLSFSWLCKAADTWLVSYCLMRVQVSTAPSVSLLLGRLVVCFDLANRQFLPMFLSSASFSHLPLSVICLSYSPASFSHLLLLVTNPLSGCRTFANHAWQRSHYGTVKLRLIGMR